jgi:protein-S-isoprenylcysteine O-methyltransferase Ste14
VYYLDRLAWIITAIYAAIPPLWIVIHGTIGYWRRHRNRALILLWPALIALLLFATAPWRDQLLYREPLAWLPAAACFATAFYIYWRSHHDFTTQQVLGLAEIEPGKHAQRLVTSGIRARVRHPLYLGHLLNTVGLCVGTGLASCYALLFFALTAGALMLRMEDAELAQRFGDDFRAYRQRVPAILPRLRDR